MSIGGAICNHFWESLCRCVLSKEKCSHLNVSRLHLYCSMILYLRQSWFPFVSSSNCSGQIHRYLLRYLHILLNRIHNVLRYAFVRFTHPQVVIFKWSHFKTACMNVGNRDNWIHTSVPVIFHYLLLLFFRTIAELCTVYEQTIAKHKINNKSSEKIKIPILKTRQTNG